MLAMARMPRTSSIIATSSVSETGNWLSGVDQAVRLHLGALPPQPTMNVHVEADAEHQHRDPQPAPAPRRSDAALRCSGARLASCSFWNTWKIVKPKLISDSDVRITDISVRSALIRVRWNDMPVRRDDSSTDAVSEVYPGGSECF